MHPKTIILLLATVRFTHAQVPTHPGLTDASLNLQAILREELKDMLPNAPDTFLVQAFAQCMNEANAAYEIFCSNQQREVDPG